MELYTMSTKSHDFLYKEMFSKSLSKHEPDLKVRAYDEPQLCLSGNYYDVGWRELMERKIDIYLEAVQSEDEFFIWSDVDVEFYAPFVE